MKTSNTKTQENIKPKRGKCLPLNGMFGVGMLFVIASNICTTFLVLTGSNNKIFWVLTAPQAGFALFILIYLAYNNN